MTKNKLILFDIDGTLLSVESRNMRLLIAKLFDELNINETEHESVSFAGRTDKAIFSDLLGKKATASGLFDEVKQRYIDLLDEQMQEAWIEVHEGAREAIEWCIERQLPYGLLTGNFEQAAYIKLRKAGLDSYFQFGAFGCDQADRNQLPGIAHRKAEHHFERHFQPEDLIIIGDTPNDIGCAQYYGARSIGITTGPYTETSLRSHNPDTVISSLKEPNSWLSDFV
ncbi:MAG: HAD family hydrolase [Balneolales bacterium]|nr:HAD family hydrolase [Balneolales bacterium]